MEFPKFETKESRLKSLDRYPKDYPSKEKLAEAGFFYSGNGVSDDCQCYYCGTKLIRWSPNDDPVEEHRVFKADCPLLSSKSVIATKCNPNFEVNNTMNAGGATNSNANPNVSQSQYLSTSKYSSQPGTMITPSIPKHIPKDDLYKTKDDAVNLSRRPRALSKNALYATNESSKQETSNNEQPSQQVASNQFPNLQSVHTNPENQNYQSMNTNLEIQNLQPMNTNPENQNYQSMNTNPENQNYQSMHTNLENQNIQPMNTNPGNLNYQSMNTNPGNLNYQSMHTNLENQNIQPMNTNPENQNYQSMNTNPENQNYQSMNTNPGNLNYQSMHTNLENQNIQPMNTNPGNQNYQSMHTNLENQNIQPMNTNPGNQNYQSMHTEPENQNIQPMNTNPGNQNHQFMYTKPEIRNHQFMYANPRNQNHQFMYTKPEIRNHQFMYANPRNQNHQFMYTNPENQNFQSGQIEQGQSVQTDPNPSNLQFNLRPGYNPIINHHQKIDFNMPIYNPTGSAPTQFNYPVRPQLVEGQNTNQLNYVHSSPPTSAAQYRYPRGGEYSHSNTPISLQLEEEQQYPISSHSQYGNRLPHPQRIKAIEEEKQFQIIPNNSQTHLQKDEDQNYSPYPSANSTYAKNPQKPSQDEVYYIRPGDLNGQNAPYH